MIHVQIRIRDPKIDHFGTHFGTLNPDRDIQEDMATNGIPQSAYALAMAPWAIHGQSTGFHGARDPKYPIQTPKKGSIMGHFWGPNRQIRGFGPPEWSKMDHFGQVRTDPGHRRDGKYGLFPHDAPLTESGAGPGKWAILGIFGGPDPKMDTRIIPLYTRSTSRAHGNQENPSEYLTNNAKYRFWDPPG